MTRRLSKYSTWLLVERSRVQFPITPPPPPLQKKKVKFLASLGRCQYGSTGRDRGPGSPAPSLCGSAQKLSDVSPQTIPQDSLDTDDRRSRPIILTKPKRVISLRIFYFEIEMLRGLKIWCLLISTRMPRRNIASQNDPDLFHLYKHRVKKMHEF